MTTYEDLATRYIATWNETDPAARKAAVADLFTPDAHYVDPLADAGGHDALDATIAAVQGQFPGFRFRLAGPVDGHHDQARFTWELGPEGASPAPIAGFDVAVTDEEGRIRSVFGFLDRVPTS